VNSPAESLTEQPSAADRRQLATLDPNDPPWGLPTAIAVWLASVFLLMSAQVIALAWYVHQQYGAINPRMLAQTVEMDPKAALVSLVAVVPAHILTLIIAWITITRFGHLSFRAAVGWSWSEHMGPWTSALLAVALLLLGGAIIKIYGETETFLDRIIRSSLAAKMAVAFLAAVTAPLVEELVYRGILYPALQRAVGMISAVLAVSAVFAVVHFAQYKENPAVFIAICVLSLSLTLVRAKTGKLLPCYFIHFVFNAIQAVVLLAFNDPLRG